MFLPHLSSIPLDQVAAIFHLEIDKVERVYFIVVKNLYIYMGK